MLNNDHVMHFIAFGYVPLRGLFSRGEAAALREEFDRLLLEAFPDFDGSQSRNVAHICERGERHAALLEDERLLDIPRKILGHDFVYEGSASSAHVGDTPWHGGSGVTTWGLPHIKVSLYLDDLTADNGCLRVVPGAHRNYLRFVDPRWTQAPDYYIPLRNRNTTEEFRPWGLRPEEVPHIPLESSLGDVLVFTEDIPHAAFGGSGMRVQLAIAFLANPVSADEEFRPWGLRPEEVPHIPLESSLGDVLVFTEDIPHAAFGGSGMRVQLAIAFLANPVSAEQRGWLKERHAGSDGELRPPRSFIESDDPRKRKMVQPLVDLGFEPRDP
jgi:ectoine hydroxylase-related dioxygenase (phytanoyl-CoA dioxygenase family)